MKKEISVLISNPITDEITDVVKSAFKQAGSPESIQFLFYLQKGDKQSYDNVHKLASLYPADMFSEYQQPKIKMIKGDYLTQNGISAALELASDGTRLLVFIEEAIPFFNCPQWDRLYVNTGQVHIPDKKEKEKEKPTASQFYTMRHGDSNEFLAKSQVITLLEEFKKL